MSGRRIRRRARTVGRLLDRADWTRVPLSLSRASASPSCQTVQTPGSNPVACS
jgi:hypothetical protein